MHNADLVRGSVSAAGPALGRQIIWFGHVAADGEDVLFVGRKDDPMCAMFARAALPFAEKLDAAEASCLQLKILEALGDSWRETYCDLRGSVHRVQFHLRRVAAAKRPTR